MIDIWRPTIAQFLTSVESKSFSEAASKLGIAQASLSTSIAKLEGELRFKLFERKKQGISVTPKGSQLYELLKFQKSNIESAWENLGHTEDNFCLRFGVRQPTFYGTILPNLSALLLKFPRLQVFVNKSSDLFSAVNSQQLDLALIGWPDTPSGNLEVQLFERVPIRIVGLRRRFGHISKAKNISDLKKEPWVHVGLSVPESWTETLGTHGTGFVVNDVESFRKLVLGGFAIGAADLDYFSKDELRQLTLSKVSTGLTGGGVHLISRPHRIGRVHTAIEEIKVEIMKLAKKY